MLVHQFATRSGLSPHTIRHYVRIGLLRPLRSANGYARFGEDALAIAEVIQIGKALGFSLNELKSQLEPFHDGEVRFEDIRDVLLEKEAEVTRRINALTAARKRLRAMLAHCPLRQAVGSRKRVSTR